MKSTKKIEVPILVTVVLIITTTLFQSCKKDNNDLSSNTWIEEELNDELTISFPETYMGLGRQPNEEGFQFSKQRQDNKVVFAISGETFFLNYGESINKPLSGTYGRLDSFEDIFNGDELQGRFYYIQNNGGTFRQSDGVYFIKRDDNKFSQVIGVSYSIDTFDEVVKILENIKKK